MKDRDTRSLEVINEWDKQTSGLPGHCTWSKGTLQVLINAALDEQDKITRAKCSRAVAVLSLTSKQEPSLSDIHSAILNSGEGQ